VQRFCRVRAGRSGSTRSISYFPSSPSGGGEQQMLAFGRALASGPRLMLIDELSLGLAPLIVRAIYDQLRVVVATFNTAMLVVEQNAHLALQYSDRAYVLERGQIVLSGTAQAVGADKQMKDAYLGLSTA
jgi:branched-chain amino acid transport system ATP-binding protein